MPTTKTRLYTIEQLAEKLGLNQTGPDLVSLFRHLHEAHDLERTRLNITLHYGLTDTRDALGDCKKVCKNGRSHRVLGIHDPDASQLPDETETPAQRTERLKSQRGLVGYAEMRQMPGHNGRWSDHVVGGMLKKLGCEPFGPKAKPLLFKREDAKRAIDALNQSSTKQTASRNTKPKTKKLHAELVAETCQKQRLVMMSHIAHRAGLNGDSYRVCNQLSSKLRKIGYDKFRKLGNNNLYKPDKADLALQEAGYELINPWPDWIK